MIDRLVAAIRTLPDPECEVFIAHVGGAMEHVDRDATAYPQRVSHFIMSVRIRRQDPGKNDACEPDTMQ